MLDRHHREGRIRGSAKGRESIIRRKFSKLKKKKI